MPPTSAGRIPWLQPVVAASSCSLRSAPPARGRLSQQHGELIGATASTDDPLIMHRLWLDEEAGALA
jgi:hypothetical protein